LPRARRDAKLRPPPSRPAATRSSQLATDPQARDWLALRSIAGVGEVTCRKLFAALGSAQAVFRAHPDSLGRAGVGAGAVREIVGFSRWDEIDREIERADRLGADLVSLSSERYPHSLRFTHDPPTVLYVRGRLERSDVEAIAIVGSRAASAYGISTAERLARDLASTGIVIVSGLALGIDAAAHRGALAAGGRTIAVLGCGIDRIYPVQHRRLAAQIEASGAILSEFPIGAAPEPGNFPRRNRVVSGLALGVVVVEAGEKSGSLITARLALEQGREVLAVPGEAGLDRTRGTHRLLREGARLVERAADVLEDVLPWRTAPVQKRLGPAASPLSAEAAAVLGGFENTTEHVDRLIERSGLGAAQTLEILLELEIAGAVRRHPGMVFSKLTG